MIFIANQFTLYGGIVIPVDGSASGASNLSVLGFQWSGGQSAVATLWTKEDGRLTWNDAKIGAAVIGFGICTMATDGAGAAACGGITAGLWADGEVEAAVDHGLWYGGKRAEWGGFVADSTVNTVTAILSVSLAGGAYLEMAGTAGSVGLARALNGLSGIPGLTVTLGNP